MCEILQCCWLALWLRESTLPVNTKWMEWNHPCQDQINTTLHSFICWVWCATAKWYLINRKCLIMLFPASLLTSKHSHINRQKQMIEKQPSWECQSQETDLLSIDLSHFYKGCALRNITAMYCHITCRLVF